MFNFTANQGICRYSPNYLCNHSCYIDSTKQKGYICLCKKNYILESDQKSCSDINECKNSSLHNCTSNHEYCINTEGSYYCKCDKGFQKRIGSKGCEDIDECKNGLHNCDQNAICINTIGSFQCFCKDEYEGDGLLCFEKHPLPPEIDWCTKNPLCAKNTDCLNLQTIPICNCKFHYYGDPYKSCEFRSPKMNLIFTGSIKFPMIFRKAYNYNYSLHYFDMKTALEEFLQIFLGSTLENYVEHSIQILNIKYGLFYLLNFELRYNLLG